MMRKKLNKRVQIIGVDGKRRNFVIGDATRSDTIENARKKLKSLVLAKRLGDLPDEDMCWIAEQDEAMKRRLLKLGVISIQDITPEEEKPLPTIKQWVNEVIKLKRNETTKRKFRNTCEKLVAFFGKEKCIDAVTKADAKRFLVYLIEECKLNQHSTARRYIGYCREIWYLAIEDRLLTENPFKQKALKATVKTNTDKHHFIDRKVSQRLYEVINNDDYRLRFVLMRFAGLRSPSELNALRWTDVDFEKSEMTIRSAKTEHQDDRGIRRCPIFPEVLYELNKAWDRARDGTINVLPRISNHTLRKHVLRWIGTVGENVWPQLLVNFRRSARTEKALEGYPSHIINAWFGHSEDVSKVYLMETEDARTKAFTAESKLEQPKEETNRTPLNPKES